MTFHLRHEEIIGSGKDANHSTPKAVVKWQLVFLFPQFLLPLRITYFSSLCLLTSHPRLNDIEAIYFFLEEIDAYIECVEC